MENLPKIREEIGYQVLKYENAEYIKLVDKAGYTEKEPMFPLFIMEILQLANDGINQEQLMEILNSNFNEYAQDVYANVMDIIEALDEYGFMDTPNFDALKKELEDYDKASIRPSNCIGSSFSDIPEEAAKEIDEILNVSNEPSFSNAKAIAVPHIDFRIKESFPAYSKAYNAIKDTNPGLFVVIGTAHHGNSDFFMFCDKHFETPFGLVETDLELMNEIKSKYPTLTIDNRAHREEHSIEYHAVLLKRLIIKDFKILPILAGSIYEFIDSGEQPTDNSSLNNQINIIKECVYAKYPNAVIIASGDLAHIGKRFGDDFAAREQLELIKTEDMDLIESLKNCNAEEYLGKIIATKDNRKVCGTAPFYALLKIANPEKGTFLDYNQWDDFMTESAVSYASICF
jgi:AmmeMemoRadiSam system protein B